jgi:cyclin A
MPTIDYMMYQPNLDHNMRSVVCDWLMEVSREYAIGRETLHMAINYFDRFLSYHTAPCHDSATGRLTYGCAIPESCVRGANPNSPPTSSEDRISVAGSCEKIKVDRANMQLLGVACLFIAAKAEEIYPPSAKDMSITTDRAYSSSQVSFVTLTTCLAMYHFDHILSCHIIHMCNID